MIAQQHTADFAKDLGFEEIAFHTYPVHTDSKSELNKRLDGLLSAVSYGDLVVLQFPTWNGLEYDRRFIEKLKAYQDLKLIIFVHDIPPLMFETNYYLLASYIDLLNHANVLILPSYRQFDFLKSQGLTVNQYTVQEFWDRPSPVELARPAFIKQIFFAGSSIEKFSFIHNWDHKVDLLVFGNGDDFTNKEHLKFLGWHSDVELMLRLSEGGFGLVWLEDEWTRSYAAHNANHKLFSYLSAGIPVIIPSYFAVADVIKENNLGFVVNDLDEAAACVESVTDEVYQELVESVTRFSKMIRSGYFSKRALTKAIGLALLSTSN